MEFKIEIKSKLNADEIGLGLMKHLKLWKKHDAIQSFKVKYANSEMREISGEVWNLNNEKLDEFPKSEKTEVQDE